MAGFTETEYTDFYEVVAANTYLVSNYVPNPNASAATVLAGLNSALAAVKATGGTLTFPSNTTYIISDTINFNNASDFQLIGNGSTIKAVNAMATTSGKSIIRFNSCKNFHIEGLTFDGNRENRVQADTSAHNVYFDTCNATSIGGGRASIANCTFTKAPGMDGVRFQGGNVASTASYSRNFLVYKCNCTYNYRLGLFIRHGYNIQILGGSLSYNGYLSGSKPGADPNSGMDIEPEEVDADPGADQILVKGVSFLGNTRSGVQTTKKSLPVRITFDGCLFDGTGHLTTSAVTDRASGIVNSASDVVVKHCEFRNFDTTYSPLSSILYIYNFANDMLIDDCHFNNCSQADNCIVVSKSSGTGNAITGCRSFNCAGALVQNNKPAGCTVNNPTPTGIISHPTPAAPVDVTFGVVTPPSGGDIAFDASSTKGSEFSTDTTWTHTPVGTPKGVVVYLVERLGSNNSDDVIGVTYGGFAMTREVMASDSATETGASYAYFLGRDVPTGPQTVAVNLIASPVGFFQGVCETVTADNDTEVTASAVVEENQANPSMALVTPAGVECFVSGALFSGAAAAGVAVGTDYTEILEVEHAAARTFSFMRRTANSTGGTVTVDWAIAAADDVAGVALALNNVILDLPTNVNVNVNTSFERLREFGGVTVTTTTPAAINVVIDLEGFERLREFGDVMVSIPNPTIVVLEAPPTDELEFPTQRFGGINKLLHDYMNNDIMLQDGYNGTNTGQATPIDSIDLIEDVEIDENLHHAGGLNSILRRLRDNDIAINTDASLGVTLLELPDTLINYPFMYADGLLTILTRLRDNDAALLEAIDLVN